MATENIRNCSNCGAALQHIDGQLKCVYCGSLGVPQIEESRPDVVEPLPSPTPTPANDEEGRIGCVVVVIIAIIMTFGIALLGIKNSKPESISADSIAVAENALNDTAATDTTSKNAAKATPVISPELKAMAKISVDPTTFKKLYLNAKREKDEFSTKTYIRDQTSPKYINANGIFLVIERQEGENTLYFKLQYLNDDWLNINQAIFNTDGENHTYTWQFQRDVGDGQAWEWYYTDVDNEYFLETIVEIATAKKAKVKFNGDKYYKIKMITSAQQMALKRQLRIYKGLLLGYDKIK